MRLARGFVEKKKQELSSSDSSAIEIRELCVKLITIQENEIGRREAGNICPCPPNRTLPPVV